MNSPWLKIAEAVGALCGYVMAVYFTYWRFRQAAKQRELRLDDNPERCGKHEEAINTIKERLGKLEDKNAEEHGEMFKQLGSLSLEIAKLGRNGNGK